MPGKPRRAVLRKATDSDIHPAEPRVVAKAARAVTAARPRTPSAGKPARADGTATRD